FLNYRYNPIPLAPRANLSVSMNQAYVGAIPLPAGDRMAHKGREMLTVPAGDMAPATNTLRMDFFLPVAKSGLCVHPSLSPVQGAILPSSLLDLKGVPHWAALPNLQLFSNAGFPFTRFADLSQTAIVIPQNPSVPEMGLLLTLVAHMGAETGFPALRLTIASSQTLERAADRDLLILGSQKDQPMFAQLARSLPVVPAAGGLSIRHAEGRFAPIRNFWLRTQDRPAKESGNVQIAGPLPEAMIEAVESPYRAGRSVVLVMVRGDEQVAPFLQAFGAAVNSSAISQSVSILHGDSFTSYRLGSSFYHVGELPLWDLLAVNLASFPYLGALLLLFVCFLLALLAQSALRRRAGRRLQDRRQIQSDDQGKGGPR
ncbi:MAG: cellulose biosynthesis cyclic di-GMP-binding regulatory protein BcsB, partial [Acidobacteriaceae bacterium]